MRSKCASLLFMAASIVVAQTSGNGALDRGLRSFAAGHFAEAEPYLRQAVTAQPRSFDARLGLGAALAQLRRSPEAIEQLEQAHRLRPDHVDTLKLLAAQYMVERQYGKAIQLLAPVAEPDEEICLLLIESYQSSGDSARA